MSHSMSLGYLGAQDLVSSSFLEPLTLWGHVLTNTHCEDHTLDMEEYLPLVHGIYIGWLGSKYETNVGVAHRIWGEEQRRSFKIQRD